MLTTPYDVAPQQLSPLATDESFDEQAYLLAHPDVAAAVEAGHINFGLQHFELHGRSEGRHLRFAAEVQRKNLKLARLWRS